MYTHDTVAQALASVVVAPTNCAQPCLKMLEGLTRDLPARRPLRLSRARIGP